MAVRVWWIYYFSLNSDGDGNLYHALSLSFSICFKLSLHIFIPLSQRSDWNLFFLFFKSLFEKKEKTCSGDRISKWSASRYSPCSSFSPFSLSFSLIYLSSSLTSRCCVTKQARSFIFIHNFFFLESLGIECIPLLYMLWRNSPVFDG